MLKLRFKRMGRKRSPIYRLVVIESTKKRDGRPVDEVGWYNPITKECELKNRRIEEWIAKGARPSYSAGRLLKTNRSTTSL